MMPTPPTIPIPPLIQEIADLPIDTPPRRPGAQRGNHNALKHGFYTSRFRSAELKNLPQKEDFVGLNEEITLLRLLIRRQVEHANQAVDIDQRNEVLRLLCVACVTLNRLLRTHVLLFYSQDELDKQLNRAIDKLILSWPMEDDDIVDPDDPQFPQS